MIGAAVLLAVGLRSWEAAESSLWLDELHTLYHASWPNVPAVVESVRHDYHTPLFYVAVHFAGDWSDGVALRWLAVLGSLACIPLLMGLLADAGATRRQIGLAVLLYASLPYEVHYGTELRPYAWLGCLSLGAFWLAFTTRGPAWVRFLLFSTCVFLGLLTHRWMAIAVFSIGVARVFVRPPGVLRLRALVAAGVLAVAPSLPWLLRFAQGAAEGRDRFEQADGSYRVRSVLIKELLALPVRIVEPYIAYLGGMWTQLAVAGSALLLLGVGVACITRLAARRAARRHGQLMPPGAALVRGAVLYGATAFVLTTAFAWFSWDRVPLQYYVGIAWIVPLGIAWIVGEVPAPRLAGLAIGTVALGSIAMGIALAGGESRADVRGGVEVLRTWGNELEGRGEQPLYTARLQQPPEVGFSDLLPFRAYAPDLEALEPADVPAPGTAGFERPLLVYRRVLPLTDPRWQPILAGRRIAREERIDWHTWVYELRPEKQ